MDATELVAEVRLHAKIGDAHQDYTDAIIRDRLWRTLTSSLMEPLVRANGGFGRDRKLVPLPANTRSISVPYRAATNAVEIVELQSGAEYTFLLPLGLRDAGLMESATGDPTHFVVSGDQIELYPKATSANVIRVTYMVKPSRIVAPASATAGIVLSTDPDPDDPTITVVSDFAVAAFTIPLFELLFLDVVSGRGSCDFHMVSGRATGSPVGTVQHFVAGTDVSRVQLGDLLRPVRESEWPTILHEEFHPTLAEATAAGICLDIGKSEKASMLSGKAGRAISNMIAMQEPRVRKAPAVLRRRGGLRNRRRRLGIAPG